MYPLILKLSDLSENKETKLNIVSLCKADVKRISWGSLDYQLSVTTLEMDA